MQTIRVAEGCTRCPGLVASRHCIVHGYGPPNARIVFVGEAPGCKGGDLTGVPFTRDRSGVRLQRVLIHLGLSAETDPHVEQPRLHCFVTNAVRCNPPSNRLPTQMEISNCQSYLWQELSLLQPEIIVLLGSVAGQAVFPKVVGQPAPPIRKAHAQVWVRDGRAIVPARHPARASNADLDRLMTVLRPLLQG